MAQFYTLDEAARVLGMSPEDLRSKAQDREIRAFLDGGTWQFRVADIDELARRRGLGSDPDFSLSDPEMSLSKLDLEHPAASDDLDLSEFQLGTAKPDFGQPTMDVPAFADDEKDVLLDDLSVPGGGHSSSSTILGMHPHGKLPSDSDVRLVPDNAHGKGTSDSDVRLAPDLNRKKDPSDSDVTLIKDDESVLDFPTKHGLAHARGPGETPARHTPAAKFGSSAEIPAGQGHSDADSDFELTPSSVIDALQPESGSDFELSAIDASSDEFESTPLTKTGPGDSDVTAAAPADSGINLGNPSDSGINLGGFEKFNFQADSIELAPIDDEDDGPKRPAPKPAPAVPRPSLSATPPPATRKGEKDIFEDTDFEVDALDSAEGDADDRTMQLEAASDFDLDEADSASEVFAIDEDDVDENASTAMAPALLDEESGEFDAGDDAGSMGSSGWDVDSESPMPTPSAASQGTTIATSRDNAEWGGLWVGFLAVGTVLTLLAAFVSVDLMRNLYDFRGAMPVSSGIIKALSGLLPS